MTCASQMHESCESDRVLSGDDFLHVAAASIRLKKPPPHITIRPAHSFIYMLTHLNTNLLTYSFIYMLTHLAKATYSFIPS